MEVTGMVVENWKKIAHGALASMAALGLAAAPIAQAQDTAEPVQEGNATGLDLPAVIKFLGENNPNLRTAAAKVNGMVITGTDVEQRVALVLAANEAEVSEEEELRLRLQVLNNLIDESLQIQEATALEIPVSAAEVDQTYERVATQNFGRTVEALDEYLESIGSSPTSLKRQIEGELAWSRILRRNIQPFISVSEEEVNELLERLKASKGAAEYRLGEIFLAATDQDRDAVRQNAQQIAEQIQQGGSFVGYARQFSQASTAAVGGDLGWIQLPQLRSNQLESIVGQMEQGQLVGPVEIPGGFWIVLLIDKRQVLTADPRDAVLALAQITYEMPAGQSPADRNAAQRRFQEFVASMRGCGDLGRAQSEFGAQVVSNDQITARSLPGALQNEIVQMALGQATQPFQTGENGISVLMLCGRDDPMLDGGPSFDQLMAQLEEDRVGKRAQRYLRDLRRDAVVEYAGQS